MCTRVREDGWRLEDAADAAGCSARTGYRWLRRFDAGESMEDRSSAPGSVPGRTPRAVERTVEELRRLRMTSTQIAATLGMPVSTVGAILTRLGLNRLSRLEPPEPPNRYCRRHPGELVHVDIKKLGRFDQPGHRVTGRRVGYARNRRSGWEFVHVCVDDASRIAYVEVLENERAVTAVAFIARAVEWFAARGVRVLRIMSDNGSPYVSRHWATWCAHHHIRHLRTRPYRPRTNGKAERFIQTLLREWAYAASYPSSAHRRTTLNTWIDYYNNQRPHGALSHKTPASRLHAD
jgi:transposase InsO family protein